MKIEMKNEIGGNKSYGSVKVGNIKFYIHELWGGKFRVYARGGSFKPNSGKGSWTLPDMLAVEKLIAKFEVSPWQDRKSCSKRKSLNTKHLRGG